MLLRCPKCKSALHVVDHHYECQEHHVYDIAKSGYCNLLLGNHKATGDNKAMVQARTCFLSHSYYRPICNEIVKLLEPYKKTVMIDAGCGEGFYTNHIQQCYPNSELYGFDLSKYALKEASKASNMVQYAVASIFQLPLPDFCGDVALSIFAPVAIDEMKRIVKDGGILLKVEPGPKHLYDLKKVLYEQVIDNKCDACLYEGFTLIEEHMIDYEITIHENTVVNALFQMTPYYWKSPKASSDRLKAMDSLTTLIQIHFEVYQKKVEM